MSATDAAWIVGSGAGTALGGLGLLALRRPSEGTVAALLGLTGGVMTAPRSPGSSSPRSSAVAEVSRVEEGKRVTFAFWLGRDTRGSEQPYVRERLGPVACTVSPRRFVQAVLVTGLRSRGGREVAEPHLEALVV